MGGCNFNVESCLGGIKTRASLMSWDQHGGNLLKGGRKVYH